MGSNQAKRRLLSVTRVWRSLKARLPVGAIAVSAMAAVVTVPQPALAQPSDAKAPDPKVLAKQLASGDAAQIESALAAMEEAGQAAEKAVPAAADLLVRGTTAPLAERALQALGAVGSPKASAAIAPYLQHRDQQVRRAAVQALVETGGKDAVGALQRGLRSSDGVVRGYSATGLGSLGARDALGDLFLALDRKITEAAAAIGQLCNAKECGELADKLGRVDFLAMTSGFDAILFRDKPLAESVQLDLVGRIREVGTPDAGQYLNDVLSRWPDHYSSRVKSALEQAVASIPGATDDSEDE